ncbi:hypothetical protein MBLNU457_4663t1 [Dothideomycetes sp. NU457]
MTTPSLFANTARRLSTPYQYHNAPEVLPASGLELDDSTEKQSDKITSITRGHRLSSLFNFKPPVVEPANSKPPLILCDMKPRRFLLVSAVLICISVACLVGGILGNKAIQNNASVPAYPAVASPSANAPSVTVLEPSSKATASSSVTTPTSDCPTSNHTIYTSLYTSELNASAVTSAALLSLTFTKYCSLSSPHDAPGYTATISTAAYVYAFNDCIELCAAYNFYANNTVCGYAMYRAQAPRPGNCWVGWTNLTSAGLDTQGEGLLRPMTGTDVALLAT